MIFEPADTMPYLLSTLIVISIIVISGAGIVVGYNLRTVGILLWSVLVLVADFCIFFDSGYRDLMSTMYGARGGQTPDEIIFTIIGAHLALYGLFVWVGKASRRGAEDQDIEDAAVMTADEFVRIINAAVAYPILGQGGWLATRWATMEAAERHHWVSRNIDALRILEARTGGAGIENLGTDPPSTLPRIEEDAPRARWKS